MYNTERAWPTKSQGPEFLSSTRRLASLRVRAVGEKSGGKVTVCLTHAGTLREVLKHRVSRIAEQRHPPAAPLPYRFAVAKDPHTPPIDFREQRPRLRACASESVVKFARVAITVPL